MVAPASLMSVPLLTVNTPTPTDPQPKLVRNSICPRLVKPLATVSWELPAQTPLKPSIVKTPDGAMEKGPLIKLLRSEERRVGKGIDVLRRALSKKRQWLPTVSAPGPVS